MIKFEEMDLILDKFIFINLNSKDFSILSAYPRLNERNRLTRYKISIGLSVNSGFYEIPELDNKIVTLEKAFQLAKYKNFA